MTKIFTKEENQAWANTLPTKMSSACIALVSDGQVLMVKAGYKDHWTFPSGIVDVHESPKAAAIRETYEEVGLTIDEKDCALLTVIYTHASNGDNDRYNFAFTASLPSQNISLSVPNDEIESAEWVDFSEVAMRTDNKGSYIKLQQELLGADVGPYTEVNPVQ